MEIRLKRVYDEPTPGDGFRVLVDRLWPRGLSKERAALDLWANEVAPSTELRKAFHHDDLSWPDFEAAYRAELAGPTSTALASLREELAAHPVVTLLHAVNDEAHNHALILRDALES
ncbi:DUF488 family protein [Microbacterium sp. QXD-8]|uniref:DUF488 family protein n=1 Tax=Microbacterium psychrotolerans TaxID=3068321 RepID=A0ABU0Z3Z0_9MICO|nr:DUF488 family protein [Microbacterium sp. QXD-8]MDQ7879307.1 DUF488 family protein [Microbacterium sp. QXD-8]